MAKHFLVTIALLLALIPAGASWSCSDTQAPSRGLLWEITSDTTTVYLLGSIHVAKADMYPLTGAINAAFDESRVLVVEVDVTALEYEETMNLMNEGETYPEGDSLANHITEDTYNALAARMEEFGVPMSEVDPYQPWAVAAELQALRLIEHGYDPEYGVDVHFLNRANDEGKGIRELETERRHRSR